MNPLSIVAGVLVRAIAERWALAGPGILRGFEGWAVTYPGLVAEAKANWPEA